MTGPERTFLAISVALTFLACGVAQAKCKDDLQFHRDKQLHFVGSGVISGTVTHVTDSKLAGFIASAAVGAAIEIRDGNLDKCGSWEDFAFDLLGNLAGLGSHHIFISPNRIWFKKEF